MIAPPRAASSRVRLALWLATHQPLLLADYVRHFVRFRVRPEIGQLERRPTPDAITPDEARALIARLMAGWEDGAALTRVRAHAPGAARAVNETLGQPMAGDTSFGELGYALVRALRPPVVVETGVASGATSAYLLAGLADNGAGELHSIDLPPTRLLEADLVGAAVPAELRTRWKFHWGSSHRLLPRVLRRTAGRMTLFVHDSDNSYSNMRWELHAAWRVLPPGGWIVANEVSRHTAFQELAAAVGGAPIRVSQLEKAGCTGLLRKSVDTAASRRATDPTC